MEAAEDLFAGIRPSDLRYDNVHILAEYIARAQRFSDSATQIEKSAEKLVQGSMRTAEDGVKQFRTLLSRMQSEFKGLESLLRQSLDAAGNEIAEAVSEAHAAGAHCILQAGELTREHTAQLASRATDVYSAAVRLEDAAALAEAARQRSYEQLEKLQVFKRELVQFESESKVRIAAARSELYKGLGLWQRIVYVFSAPVPTVRESKAPSRPPALGNDSSPPSPPLKGQVRTTGNVRTSSATNKRHCK